jgi:hypothetical protein
MLLRYFPRKVGACPVRHGAAFPVSRLSTASCFGTSSLTLKKQQSAGSGMPFLTEKFAPDPYKGIKPASSSGRSTFRFGSGAGIRPDTKRLI